MVTGDKLIQVQHVKKYYNHGAIKALDEKIAKLESEG